MFYFSNLNLSGRNLFIHNVKWTFAHYHNYYVPSPSLLSFSSFHSFFFSFSASCFPSLSPTLLFLLFWAIPGGTQSLLLVVLWGPYVVLGIVSGSTVCKARITFVTISLAPSSLALYFSLNFGILFLEGEGRWVFRIIQGSAQGLHVTQCL